MSSSSCCAGKCSCGSDCKCGSSCSCSVCKMYPDTSSFETTTTTETLILGVAPNKSEIETGGATAEHGGCKCNTCNCDPCSCK